MVPALIGLLRIKKMNPIFYPFICFIWVGFLNEIVSNYSIALYGTNTFNINIYCLLEALLILYQFKIWGAIKSVAFKLIALLIIIFWILGNLITGLLLEFDSLFIIFYCFILVIISIIQINKILIEEKRGLIKNPVFLITIGFTLYLAYSLIIEIIYKFSYRSDVKLSARVYELLLFINLFNNILYSYAILCMRRKLRFTMSS